MPGLADSSIELEIGEGFFGANLGNWQESQTQEEPDLLGTYQDESLGAKLRGEALLFEGVEAGWG